MLLAAFEPGQEMAIANFFLAIFCLFTIALPFLLITRGDKTEANRDFIAATVNPWSQIGQKIELTPVVVSGITPTIDAQPKTEFIAEGNDKTIPESEEIISLEIKRSEEQEEVSAQKSENNDEVLVA
mgnify:CR=1 FL=1